MVVKLFGAGLLIVIASASNAVAGDAESTCLARVAAIGGIEQAEEKCACFAESISGDADAVAQYLAADNFPEGASDELVEKAAVCFPDYFSDY